MQATRRAHVVLLLVAVTGCGGSHAGTTIPGARTIPQSIALSTTACPQSPVTMRAVSAESFGWYRSTTSATAGRQIEPMTASGPQSSLAGGLSPRPGPDILYAPLATAPQFQNSGIWAAPPILISGTSSYRSHEYVYQGFLYDDTGAKEVRDPAQTAASPDYIAYPSGTYTYPTDPAYVGNAANIVDFRMKLTSTATAFRMTFNSMTDPSLIAFTIGLGSAAASSPMPHGANTKQIAQVFVTVHGNSVDVVSSASGALLANSACTSGLTTTPSTTARQVDVRMPFTVFDPRGSAALRVSVASGLWNSATNAYLLPQAASTAATPGGAGTATAPPAFFNLGFRHAYNEPFQAAGLSQIRDTGQSAALANGDISTFADVVDMNKLANGADDDMVGQPQGVTRTGPMDRVLASHYALGQGVKFSSCNGFVAICGPEYLGNLQPYEIYIPAKQPPATGYGLTLQLHALTGTYNQLANQTWQMQLGERGTGSIVITPEGRGPDNWYYNLGGADVFEVWADVAARYKLDPHYTAIDGYSMGGYGSFKLSTSYPDLFARAHTLVGTVAAQTDYNGGPPVTGVMTEIPRMLPSLRNVPIMMFYAGQDELVPIGGSTELQQSIDALHYRYEWDVFNPAEHLTIFTLPIFDRDAAFLGEARVDPNPAHVTFVYNPVWNDPQHGLMNDHAYWLSEIKLRDGSGSAPLGTIDVRSEAFGQADPLASAETPVAGTVPAAGTSYQGFTRTWANPASARTADALDISATNIASVTINPQRARIDCRAALHIATDGALTVQITGCPARAFQGGAP
ncbi:MAG: putative penicillin acylase [Candidatus Eremiobacteraeota bacterium]|nr:putative penicillin acylase [Candidatus Eremiobacteraeota bacterium]